MNVSHESDSGRYWLLVALALTAAVQTITVFRSPAIAPDGVTFIRLAQGLSEHPVSVMREADQHPGYPVMILASHWLGDLVAGHDSVASWLLAARMAPWLFGVLSVGALWLLTRRVSNSLVAGVCAVMFAGLPLFRQNAADALSDTPCLFFCLLGTWAAAEGLVRRRSPWFVVTGLSSGAAYLIRPEGLGVGIVAFVVLMTVGLLRREGWKPGVAVVCAGGLVLSAALMCTPYVLVKGKLTAKKNPAQLVMTGTLRHDHEAPAISRQETSPIDSASQPREDLAARRGPLGVMYGAGRLVKEVAYGLRYVLLLALVPAMVAPGRQRCATGPWMLFAGLIALNAFVLVALYRGAGYIDHRHVMFMSALLTPWAASGTVWFALKCSQARWLNRVIVGFLRLRFLDVLRRRPHLSVIVAVAPVVLSLLPWSVRPAASSSMALVRGASWVRAHKAEQDILLSNSAYVLFYADMDSQLLTPDRALPVLTGPGGRPLYRFVAFDRQKNYREDWPLRLTELYRIVDVPEERTAKSRLWLMELASPVNQVKTQADDEGVR